MRLRMISPLALQPRGGERPRAAPPTLTTNTTLAATTSNRTPTILPLFHQPRRLRARRRIALTTGTLRRPPLHPHQSLHLPMVGIQPKRLLPKRHPRLVRGPIHPAATTIKE